MSPQPFVVEFAFRVFAYNDIFAFCKQQNKQRASFSYLGVVLVCLLQYFRDNHGALVPDVIPKMLFKLCCIATDHHTTGELKGNYLTHHYPSDVKQVISVMCCV